MKSSPSSPTSSRGAHKTMTYSSVEEVTLDNDLVAPRQNVCDNDSLWENFTSRAQEFPSSMEENEHRNVPPNIGFSVNNSERHRRDRPTFRNSQKVSSKQWSISSLSSETIRHSCLLCLVIFTCLPLPVSSQDDNSSNKSLLSSSSSSPFSTVDQIMWPKRVWVGVLLPQTQFGSNYNYGESRMAIEIAMGKVSKDPYLLPGVELDIESYDTKCSDQQGPLTAAHMHYDNKADLFIGPYCLFVLGPVARYSSKWGVPVLTPAGLVDAFANKGVYKTMTRVQGTYQKATEFLHKIMAKFDWRTVGLMFHHTSAKPPVVYPGVNYCFFVMRLMFKMLRIRGQASYDFFNQDQAPDYESKLKQMTQKSRSE